MNMDIIHAASAVFSEYMRVDNKSERVLVIYDYSSEVIANALVRAAEQETITCDTRKIVPPGENGKDPDPETCELMKQYDVIIAPTFYSLTHCVAVRHAKEAGARVATLPGATEDIFMRGLSVDPMMLNSTGNRWIKVLSGKHSVTITSDAGTALEFSIGKYPLENDDGCIFESGIVGNLPAGEVFIAPDPDSANGTIVFDGSIAGEDWSKDSTPASFTVEKGYMISGRGERGKRLYKLLSSYGEKGLFLAEFGIGTNPHFKISGNLLEDEKVKGTIHLAFGNNCGFGGNNDVPVHIDGLVVAPTILLDGKQTLMEKGKWLV